MTEREIIDKYADACKEEMRGGGVLASVNLALIMIGRLSGPDSHYLINAHNGRKNRGAPLYPGIDKCKTFGEAARILGDTQALLTVNDRWNLERFDRSDVDLKAAEPVAVYQATSTRIPLYAGPGKKYARLDHCSRKGSVEIVKEKDGFGKIKGTNAWVELSRLKEA